jgi:putative membrane protein
MASAIVAALHYLALAIGLPAVFLRGRALRGALDQQGVRRVLAADTAWGIAAILWLTTGPARAFGPLEKGTGFYLASTLFWVKMSLFLAVFLLELGPMRTFIRWRRELRAGGTPDTTVARRIYVLNQIELHLVVLIVFVASFMARGFGLRAG